MTNPDANRPVKNIRATDRKPVCVFRAILAGLSILLLLCLSSLEPVKASKADSKQDTISLLPYHQLLKSLVPRNNLLHDEQLVFTRNKDSSDEHPDNDLLSTDIESLFLASEQVNARFGFECISKILDCDDDGSVSRIFAKFEYKDPVGKALGVLEQSFLVKGDEFTCRIEHVSLPSGKRMSIPIIQETLKVLGSLSANPRNRIELEAASGKHLVGAYVWAKRGFKFLSGERDALEAQLVAYIQKMHPFEPKEQVLSWIKQHRLVNPEDFISLPKYEPHSAQGFKSILTRLNFKSQCHRKFAKQHSELGLAFLLDPRMAARWEGEMIVGEA
ncbi:MAG: hypothetical protein HRU09_05510 [Oligoflexales bacterium]|nr:hypothetical protein [Oligoflexales bacterium]